uniref:Uncharacterized protein n=1 Tax=Sinocyclocheilus grahami TaxID=75366 RepID=A0A672L2T9_SINGR
MFYLGLIRPENFISHHLGVLHAGFHLSCTEERLPSGHSALKPRLGSGRPKRLPFKDYGGHCALRNLKSSRNFFVTLAKSVPCHNSVSELWGTGDQEPSVGYTQEQKPFLDQEPFLGYTRDQKPFLG